MIPIGDDRSRIETGQARKQRSSDGDRSASAESGSGDFMPAGAMEKPDSDVLDFAVGTGKGGKRPRFRESSAATGTQLQCIFRRGAQRIDVKGPILAACVASLSGNATAIDGELRRFAQRRKKGAFYERALITHRREQVENFTGVPVRFRRMRGSAKQIREIKSPACKRACRDHRLECKKISPRQHEGPLFWHTACSG